MFGAGVVTLHQRRRNFKTGGAAQAQLWPQVRGHRDVSEPVRRPVEAAAPGSDERSFRCPQSPERLSEAAASRPQHVAVYLHINAVCRRSTGFRR